MLLTQLHLTFVFCIALVCYVCCSSVLSTGLQTTILSPDLVLCFQHIANSYLSLPLILIMILFLSAWLMQNTDCQLTPYCCWVDPCVSKLKFSALYSCHLYPSAVLAVPVSNTRGTWTGIVYDFTLIISGSTVCMWYPGRCSLKKYFLVSITVSIENAQLHVYSIQFHGFKLVLYETNL